MTGEAGTPLADRTPISEKIIADDN